MGSNAHSERRRVQLTSVANARSVQVLRRVQALYRPLISYIGSV